MTTTGASFNEPGGDFYNRLRPDKAKQRAQDQPRHMGYAVTLNALQATR